MCVCSSPFVLSADFRQCGVNFSSEPKGFSSVVKLELRDTSGADNIHYIASITGLVTLVAFFSVLLFKRKFVVVVVAIRNVPYRSDIAVKCDEGKATQRRVCPGVERVSSVQTIKGKP